MKFAGKKLKAFRLLFHAILLDAIYQSVPVWKKLTRYSVHCEKRIHTISPFWFRNSMWLQREATGALMYQNRVTWEIPRDAVPKGLGGWWGLHRDPRVVRSVTATALPVYRTSVFHYVMGHCTAQSYRGGLEQCRWVSYNTSGVGADKRVRERAPRSSLRFVIKGNDRKRNY